MMNKSEEQLTPDVASQVAIIPDQATPCANAKPTDANPAASKDIQDLELDVIEVIESKVFA